MGILTATEMGDLKELEPGAVEAAYAAACERYAELGVDCDKAVEQALRYPISLQCWQGDDVVGFEQADDVTGGGIMATGNYPGRARNGDELRADLEEVLRSSPGTHKVNVHACYAETGDDFVDRDALEPAHFARWIEWAKAQDVGLDFNTTNFAHPLANDGMTLSHPDKDIRAFWIRHGRACRKIAEHMARELGQPCVLNHWLPDGMKDLPADRWAPRARLVESLDAIMDPALGIDPSLCLDAVESKLFGLGSEEYVVGSSEFYIGYAVSRGIRMCLDMGHFHPTETIHGKFSALLQFLDNLLVHVSRPVRWDSDHVVLFSDDVRAVFQELVRGNALDRVNVALDFFDASINRIGAYLVGVRATRKALLFALLEPSHLFTSLEQAEMGAEKLALMEEMKNMPFAAMWDMLCLRGNVPAGPAWIGQLERYEKKIQATRT